MRRHLGATLRITATLSALVAAPGLAAGCGGGGEEEDQPLTATEVAAQAENATVAVVVRSSSGTPLGDAGDIIGGGSGWVYDAEEGLIVTNAHVVLNGSKFEAGPSGTELTEAKLVAVNARDDLAMVRVEPSTLGEIGELELAEDPPAQGDKVFALGYPSNATSNQNFLNAPYQATEGIISTLEGRATVPYGIDQGRNDRTGQLITGLYQTDASINAGNSGGPLLNDRGEVVGTNVAAGGENQGYAISSELLATELPTLAEGESTAWLGFGASAISADTAGENGVFLSSLSLRDGEDVDNSDLKGGMQVVSVAQDTPVDQQTELSNDLRFFSNKNHLLIITSVNNRPVTSQQEYINTIENVRSGEQVSIEYLAATFDPDVQNSGPYEARFAAP